VFWRSKVFLPRPGVLAWVSRRLSAVSFVVAIWVVIGSRTHFGLVFAVAILVSILTTNAGYQLKPDRRLAEEQLARMWEARWLWSGFMLAVAAANLEPGIADREWWLLPGGLLCLVWVGWFQYRGRHPSNLGLAGPVNPGN
jgi:hypothetical protein